MSQGVEIKIETNEWAKLGKELVEKGVSKDYISAEFKSILGKVATKGKRILRDHTPVHTGFLRAAAGSKSDRHPSRLSAYALVGWLRPNYNKHQFFITLGTVERFHKSGKSVGRIIPKKPDPLQRTGTDIQADAVSIVEENIDASVNRAIAKMNDKYGNAWKTL